MISKEPNQWAVKKQSGDRFEMIHKKTGERRMAERDRKGIKRGDYLQPTGKDKEEFIKKYGWLPNEDYKKVRAYAQKKYGKNPEYLKTRSIQEIREHKEEQ